MKCAAVLFVFFGLALAAAPAAGPPSVTLSPGTLSFKQAAAACPGALGTISFTLGHTRAGALAGVTEQVDTSPTGIDTVTFAHESSGTSASVIANAHKNTVSAKHVQVKWHNQLACIMPD
jgi:hypothetical protein